MTVHYGEKLAGPDMSLLTELMNVISPAVTTNIMLLTELKERQEPS